MFQIWIYTIDKVINGLFLVGICEYITSDGGLEAVKNASSVLLFNSHSELETGLLAEKKKTNYALN